MCVGGGGGGGGGCGVRGGGGGGGGLGLTASRALGQVELAYHPCQSSRVT